MDKVILNSSKAFDKIVPNFTVGRKHVGIMKTVDLLFSEGLLDQVLMERTSTKGQKPLVVNLKDFAGQWQMVHLHELLLIYTGGELPNRRK